MNPVLLAKNDAAAGRDDLTGLPPNLRAELSFNLTKSGFAETREILRRNNARSSFQGAAEITGGPHKRPARKSQGVTWEILAAGGRSF